jgi:tryptophan-rich sensory protein
MSRLIFRFLSHVLPQVIRPLRALWNQLIGFIFLVLAASATVSAIINLRRSNGDAEDMWRAVISFTFAAIMAYFSITSFLRARKITRP